MLKRLFNTLTGRDNVPPGFPNAATFRLFAWLTGPAPADDVGKLKTLLRPEVDINFQDLDGNTALIHAVRRRLPRVAQQLLEAGAGPNFRNRDRWTALMYAAKNGDQELADGLLFRGASDWAWMPTPGGLTAWHVSDPAFRNWLNHTMTDIGEQNGRTMKTLRALPVKKPVRFRPAA